MPGGMALRADHVAESGSDDARMGASAGLQNLTELGTPHEMSYLTGATLQDALTRHQESANRKAGFPQAMTAR